MCKLLKVDAAESLVAQLGLHLLQITTSKILSEMFSNDTTATLCSLLSTRR